MTNQVARSAGLSAAFLTDVLRRPVASFDEILIGADRGFAGTVLRLQLQPVDHEPATVIAKLDAPTGTAVEHEARFYRDVASAVSAPAPHCWYAGNTAADRQVILIEDLSDAILGDVLAGTDPGAVEAILRRMTTVWRHGTGSVAGSLPGWSVSREQANARQQRYAEQWDRIASQLQLPQVIMTLGDQLRTGLARILIQLNSAPQTLLHGDLHLDNILVPAADADHPVVIDWATARTGPLAIDVIPFVTSSLSPEHHTKHAADLIHDLLTSLPAHLRNDFDDHARCALLLNLAGVVGWLSRPATDNAREAALRHSSVHDGRLVNALLHWEAHRASPLAGG